MTTVKPKNPTDYFARTLIEQYGAQGAREKVCGKMLEAVDAVISQAGAKPKLDPQDVIRTLEESVRELGSKVISGFYEDHRPRFRQGYPTHELEDVVTANEVTAYVDRIEELRRQAVTARNQMRLASEAARQGAVTIKQLRSALVGLVGVDTPNELDDMARVMQTLPASDEDKAATLAAIHALLETQP